MTETPPIGSIIPLMKRKIDILFIAFFLINLAFITYIIDIEQLIIPDPYHFTYPIWPLPFMVDTIHWYGQNFDPLLMARPVWWKMTIVIDSLFFGPFYVVATYSFIKGKNKIRIPSIIYSSTMITIVLIILSEEIFGPHKSPALLVVLADNFPWMIIPILLIYRMLTSEKPFTAEK